MTRVDVEDKPTGTKSGRVLRGAAIDSVGAALPDRVVTSAEIAELLGVDEHWVVKRTGVRERRWALPEETMADLVEIAARQALDRAGLAPPTWISYWSRRRATTTCSRAARR